MNLILQSLWKNNRKTEDLKNLKNLYPDGQCPFGIRDLNNDECYSGNGKNRCKYFVRYDWENFYGCIVCNHPEKKKIEQLELF